MAASAPVSGRYAPSPTGELHLGNVRTAPVAWLAVRAPGGRRAALRFRVPEGTISFEDRLRGRVTQDVRREVGDFVVRRADGLYTYQLAVVVDDGAMEVDQVVRGMDLLHSTPRQIALQN